MLTKATARTRCTQFADAVGSARWDVAANGEVDRTIGLCQNDEWRKLLDWNPYYKVNEITSTLDSSGNLLKSALQTGTTDSIKYPYRILVFKVGGIPYKEVKFSDHSGTNAQPYRCFYEYGDQYTVFPTQASGAFTAVVNYTPVPQHQLSGEGVTFTFPEGFEDIPLLEAAAEMLAKGGAETEAGQYMRVRAATKRAQMYAAIGRGTLNPIQWKYQDAAQDWGG